MADSVAPPNRQLARVRHRLQTLYHHFLCTNSRGFVWHRLYMANDRRAEGGNGRGYPTVSFLLRHHECLDNTRSR